MLCFVLDDFAPCQNFQNSVGPRVVYAVEVVSLMRVRVVNTFGAWQLGRVLKLVMLCAPGSFSSSLLSSLAVVNLRDDTLKELLKAMLRS